MMSCIPFWPLTSSWFPVGSRPLTCLSRVYGIFGAACLSTLVFYPPEPATPSAQWVWGRPAMDTRILTCVSPKKHSNSYTITAWTYIISLMSFLKINSPLAPPWDCTLIEIFSFYNDITIITSKKPNKGSSAFCPQSKAHVHFIVSKAAVVIFVIMAAITETRVFTFCWMPIEACTHSASKARQSLASLSRVIPLICLSESRSSRPWIRQFSVAQSSSPTKRSCRACWERCFSATWKRWRMERGKDATSEGRFVKMKDKAWMAKDMTAAK